MKTEPLSLEHKSLLRPKFQEMGLCLSEYSFASRYLFRREYNLEVIFDDDRMWIRGKTKDGITFLMPLENIQLIPEERILAALQWADCLYPIPEKWISTLNRNKFYVNFNRNESDYLFKREKIASYAGRKLSPKRNLVKQFDASHEAKVLPYTKKYMEEALSILYSWQSMYPGTSSDFSPCQDGLANSDELNLIGYIVFVEKKPAAFILGEILHSTLFDIHFAKALTTYKGIYPFLFQELANRLVCQEINCLNWEQDLGEEGLRQSKLSYQPDEIAHKYRLFPLS
ncbi:Uncharacterized conserved protein UCP018688 [Chlamydiales bacterium STE3]|nr:Uncharacterized conserved protein UCP018688 [Chlamydiales bacterium STE3]